MVSSIRSAARSLGLLRSVASIDIYSTGEALFPFFQSRFCSSPSFSSRFLEPIRSRFSKLHPSPIASPSIPPHHHTIPRVLFCSKPLDIGQDTADSSNILTEDEFHKLANQTIEYLQENLEFHTKSRNRLGVPRLDDLVYCNYNLKLAKRLKTNKLLVESGSKKYDDIYVEVFNDKSEWVKARFLVRH